MQWDLVAAAVEAAAIKRFKLGKQEAETMRGRSRITFSKNTNDCYGTSLMKKKIKTCSPERNGSPLRLVITRVWETS